MSTALRPWSLQNSGSKAIAAAMARSMTKMVSQEKHAGQRGFVGERQLTTKIMEMDAYTGLFCTTVPDSGCSVLAMLNLLAAFPIACRLFLVCALLFLDFPDGLAQVVKALYDSGTFLSQGPSICVVCRAVRGVAQGF